MNTKRMRGVYVVEFAIIGSVLFVLLFGVLEMGRLYFTVNGLEEVVRRGARLAAVCKIQDPDVLRRAIFNDAGSGGDNESRLIRTLQTSNLVLNYLNQDGSTVTAPGTTGFSTIRYVQLSIEGFSFTPLIPGLDQAITLPTFRATIPRESLGHDGATEVPTQC